MASLLYCFPYSYRSFLLLKAIAKGNRKVFDIEIENYCCCDSWKSDNYRERAINKNKITDAKNKAKKSDNFTRSNREKFIIAIAILENF